MTRYFLSFIIGLFSMAACKKELNIPPVLEQHVVLKDTTILEIKKVKFQKLSLASQKVLNDFEPHKILKICLDSLNTTKPTLIIPLLQKLHRYSVDMKNMLPQTLKTAPITARLKVLITEAGTIHEHYQKSTPTADIIEKNNQRLATAYNNLALQIDELHLEIPDNIAKELLRDAENVSDSTNLPSSSR